MTIFQLLMLGASAFFAFRIYEHIQTLQDPQKKEDNANEIGNDENVARTADSFSTFDVSTLIDNADEQRGEENLDKALAIYREANIKEPENAEVLFKMGYTLFELQRYDEAVDSILESLEYDDKNPFAYKTVSEVYKALGDEVKADEYYKKAVELDEDI